MFASSDAGPLRAGSGFVLGLVCSIAIANPSAAQTSVGRADFPMVSLAFEGFLDSRPKAPPVLSPDLETRIVHSSIEVGLLWRKSEATRFVAGAGFDLVRFDMRQNRLPWTPDDLYDIGVAASWQRRFSPDWSVSARARPHLASDLRNGGADHLNVDGSLLLRGGHRGRGRFGFGAILTSIFGRRLVLPVLELGWSRSDAVLGFEVVLPERALFIYRPSKSIELGLRGRVEGNRYRVGENVEFPAGTVLEEPLVRYSVLTVGPVVQTALSRSAYLTLESGAALFRRFDIESRNERVADLDLGSGVEVRLGLEIRR